MFKVCPTCDFEWHSKDGKDCPICSETEDYNELRNLYEGGAFGSSTKKPGLRNFFAAVGLVTLVLMIYTFFLL